MTAHVLDATGLICPLPVLKARKVLLRLQPGDVLTVTVTDAHAPKDFALFCTEAGHSLRYAFARDQLAGYQAQGYSLDEARALTSMDLGHGDGRGRYVERVYSR